MSKWGYAEYGGRGARMSEDRIVRKWALLERSNNRVRNGRLGKKY